MHGCARRVRWTSTCEPNQHHGLPKLMPKPLRNLRADGQGNQQGPQPAACRSIYTYLGTAGVHTAKAVAAVGTSLPAGSLTDNTAPTASMALPEHQPHATRTPGEAVYSLTFLQSHKRHPPCAQLAIQPL